MTVYHGSTCVIQTPNVMLAKPRLDFGRAFYLTTYRKQAEKWALRKAMRTRGKPIVNVYTLSDDFTGLRVKDFDETDAEWLDFVCACRAGRALWRKFDVINPTFLIIGKLEKVSEGTCGISASFGNIAA